MNDHTQPPTTPTRRTTPGQTREERARNHIKAAADVITRQQPGQLAQPAGLFMSGMLTGLAASVEILDGSTAEGSLENVNTRLATAIGEAYLNGTLPAQPAPADTDHQLTREEEIRGVQAWMAMDLHQALGLAADEQATHQGHGSWADWWADLCGRVRQRTHAELAHTRALNEPEDIKADQLIHPRVLTPGLPPEPGDLFFPTSYGAIRAEAHPATPNDPPYMIDLVGVTDGDPLREVTHRLIVHRSLATRLARDLAQLADPHAQPNPADELAKVDAILRDCGIEYPLGARGVKDLGSMAKSRLEDLRRTEEERAEAARLSHQYRNAAERAQASVASVRALVAGAADTTSAGISDHDIGRHDLARAVLAALNGAQPSPEQEQGAPINWQAIAEQREQELKAVGEAKHTVERDRDEARQWARHGYEIGQRHCGWSDHGVAPAWLTKGWPPHFDSCQHLSRAAELEDALARLKDTNSDLARAALGLPAPKPTEGPATDQGCGLACAEGHTYTSRCESASKSAED